MVENWDSDSYPSSSSTAVLDSTEAEATDKSFPYEGEGRNSGGTNTHELPPDVCQSARNSLDQEPLADATLVPGSSEINPSARPECPAEHTTPLESGICDGEIIEVLDSRVVCWLKISDKLRVRSALDESLFDNLPKYPGAQFCWSPDSGAVCLMEFDNDDLIAECDRLEREWDEDLKHRTPRMAD